MRTKQLLLTLALLCAVVQGIQAENGIYCTASDKGRVVCTDGTIYDNVAAATADGKTAVAKIIYVDETNKKGLALALQDEGEYNWNDAMKACENRNASLPCVGGTWKLASLKEWDNMINAAGGYYNLLSSFSGVGGTNLARRFYWSSTKLFPNTNAAYHYIFTSGKWMSEPLRMVLLVRACLEFNLLTVYEIGSQSDWNEFCAAVNNGDTFSDKYVKLTDNWISALEATAGTDETNSFQGIFDGNGNTITNNQGTAGPISYDYCAPFRHVKNAKIKNLRVNGCLYTNGKYAAGIVAKSYGMLDLTDCCSSVDITSYRADVDYHGGLVAENNGTVVANRCIFDGSFASKITGQHNNLGCGGFVGKTNESSTTTIKNSLIKPESVAEGMISNTFVGTDNGTVTIENCYFVATDNLPTNQGMKVIATAPEGEISRPITINGTTVYTEACTVSGVETAYDLDHGSVFITPVLTDPLAAAALTFGTDFTVTLDGNAAQYLPVNISTAGSHTLVLTGMGKYTGTKTINITTTGDPTNSTIYISDEAEWNAFAEKVNNGTNSFAGQFVKLTADISVSQKVGTVTDFSGTFDGQGYTITATITDNSNSGTALFQHISNATIKNLTLKGIITGNMHAAALVGFSKGRDNKIQNCTVTANVNGGSHIGGIVGHALDSNISITDCVYSGLMTDGGTFKGVFVGWGDSGNWTVTNCLYIMAEGQSTSNLDLASNRGSLTVERCFKTTSAGAYGTRAYDTAPDNEITKQLQLVDGNDYHVLCNISGINQIYAYTGSEVAVTPVVTVVGTTLTAGSDYDCTFSPAPVQEAGYYTLTITGQGSCKGTKSFGFYVTTGNGNSADDPILINSVESWKQFATNVNNGTDYSGKFVKLIQDITGINTPVGYRNSDSDNKPFRGTFDGAGHTISVSLIRLNREGCAPFSYVDNATIKNLTVAGEILENNGKYYTSGLVGFASGTNTIEGVIVTADIYIIREGGREMHGGGIVGNGLNSTTTIRNCVFAGKFEGQNASSTMVGSIWGWSDGGKPIIENCLEAGTYNYYFTRHAMGLKGNNGTVTNSYYKSLKQGYPADPCPDGKQARFISAGENVTMEIGGTVLADYPGRGLTIYSTGIKYNGTYYFGSGDEVSLTLSHGTKTGFNFDKYVATGGTLTSSQDTHTLTMPDADVTINAAWKPIDLPTDDSGNYLINSSDNWNLFCTHLENDNNFSGKTIKLTKDIEVSTMAGYRKSDSEGKPFSGIFDGQSHTITATITDTGYSGTALFGYINGATIKGLTVAGTIASDQFHMSGLVGFANGTNLIENCAVTATLDINTDYAGGIVGHGLDSDTAIRGCVFAGTMTSSNNPNVGVIWGWSNSGTPVLENCLEAGTYVGINKMHPMGLQKAKGTITNCYYVTPQIGSPSNACTVSGAKQACSFTGTPANLGDLVLDYGVLTAYQNGILYDGTYYVAPTSISLADNADNSTTISNANGSVADVKLAGRTLYRDGSWNTLFLPFGVTLSGSPLEGAVARPLTSASISGTTLNLTFGAAVTELMAGTPYIIKWQGGDNIVSPMFSGVTIDATDRSYDNGATGEERVRFMGTYSSLKFDAADPSILFMGSGNTLYYPQSGAAIGAQRAYFKIGDDGSAGALARITAFNISFGDDDSSTLGVTTPLSSAGGAGGEASWHTLDGRRLSAKPSRPGVYIYNGVKRVIK